MHLPGISKAPDAATPGRGGGGLVGDAHFLFVRAGINPGDAEGSGNFGVAGGSALADAELKGSDGSWLDDHIERDGAEQ